MIKRNIYLKKIEPFYHSDLIKVLIGIRRCGKSVLIKQIIDEIQLGGISSDQIVYLNFEDLEHDALLTAKTLHRHIKDSIKDDRKYYLFFDEIQYVVDFERAINSFRSTMNVSIFITGSNSKIFSGELATLLSGRYVSFDIYPFSFKEVCQFREIAKEAVKDEDLMDFLDWGGMPQRFQFKTVQETRVFLNDLFNSIVLKDIIQRTQIKDVDLLSRIVEYLVQNPSQTFSAQSISKYFESINRKVSTDTLYRYMEAVSSAQIINKVVSYDIRGKRILTRLDKYYLTDVGLGRIKNSGFKIEIGPLLENIIYNELRSRGYSVYVGKTRKGEIDLIADKDNAIEYYQVAYLLASEEVLEREFGAYDDIRDNYPKYVLSMDKFDFSRNGVIHKNIVDFLLG